MQASQQNQFLSEEQASDFRHRRLVTAIIRAATVGVLWIALILAFFCPMFHADYRQYKDGIHDMDPEAPLAANYSLFDFCTQMGAEISLLSEASKNAENGVIPPVTKEPENAGRYSVVCTIVSRYMFVNASMNGEGAIAMNEYSRSNGWVWTTMLTAFPLIAWVALLIAAIPATISVILTLSNPERPIKRERTARLAIMLPAFATIALFFQKQFGLTVVFPMLVLLYVLAVVCIVGSVLSNLRAAKLSKDAYAVAAKRV